MTLHDRWLAKVEKRQPAQCWPWIGAANHLGYGHISEGGGHDAKKLQAHRVSYELFVGPIPDGWVIDHLCRNPWCVNPHHLEAVTHGENIRRGYEVKNQTHCKRGHDLADAYVKSDGGRDCRECGNIRRAEWSDEQKARRRAYAAKWARDKRAAIRDHA